MVSTSPNHDLGSERSALLRAVVVGAGPAGATAALMLARAGAHVTVFEKDAWPRAKTCGDGVSPLAIRTLERLGVSFEHGLALHSAAIATPGGTTFRGSWPAPTPFGTIVPRREFDAALVAAAIAAGAEFHPATTVRDVESQADAAVVTTRAADGRDAVRSVDAVVVADGAAGGLATRLGFPPHDRRLLALRAYARSRRPLTAEYALFYDAYLSPGYGWVFPLAPDRANVGVCVDERALQRAGGDLRALLRRWLVENDDVAALVDADAELTDVRGGIIPTGRARRVNGRVFLIGDAAGVADPFTAEGILAAIRSGELVAEALARSSDVATAGRRYEQTLRELDRNNNAARLLRTTFRFCIGPYGRYAARHRRFADRLTTSVFFPKPGWFHLMWRMHVG